MAEPQLSLDEAVRTLRRDPAFADLVRDAYLERDVADSIRRFAASGEFAEVLKLIGKDVVGATVVDIGAGVGIASAAFKAAGAGQVIAIEPDERDEVGRDAWVRAAVDAEVVGADGEDCPGIRNLGTVGGSFRTRSTTRLVAPRSKGARPAV